MTSNNREAISKIIQKQWSGSTLKQYETKQKKIIAFLASEYPHICNEDGEPDLTQVTAEMFLEFLMSLPQTTIKKTGQQCNPSYSTYNGYKSAFASMYAAANIQMEDTTKNEISKFFKGLKRTEAEEKKDGARPIDEGKAALPFGLYVWIAEQFWKAGDEFALLYMILSWNLMARTNNVATLQINHLQWNEDSLLVFFSVMKTDQEGLLSKHARSVYANPKNPCICPVLTLAYYLLKNPNLRSHGNTLLFPGSNQASRFSKKLAELLKNHGTEMLSRYGMHAEDLASHSIRKGSGTYACSGSTAGPAYVTVAIRMGWRLGNVATRYLKFERAGDQYLGRILAGLSVDSTEFMVLPPFFRCIDVESLALISNLISETFYNLCSENEQLIPVLEFCLSSIIYHQDFLRTKLPSNDNVFQSALFRDGNISNFLDLISTDDTSMRTIHCTGIPPHIGIMKSIEKIPSVVLTGVESILEDKGVAAGHITRSQLDQALENILEKLTTTIQSTTSSASPPESTSQSSTYQAYMWKGSFHRLPEEFKFPHCNLLTAWNLWFEGNNELGYPPFKCLEGRDLSSSQQKKILSEWKFVMSHIEQTLKDENEYVENPNRSQLRIMFEKAEEKLPIGVETGRNRCRRSGQLHVSTLRKLIIKKLKENDGNVMDIDS